MATISEILTHKWPGSQWNLEGGTYAGLVWMGATAKPLEAEIMAFSVEVDGILVQIAAQERWRDLLANADGVLQAFEILSDAIADLQAKARVTSALTQSNINKISGLVTKLAQIRAG
tara:strand:+ start:224 stop:574 length:351 start_codon:yes stop_codon:yes gene_type:complete